MRKLITVLAISFGVVFSNCALASAELEGVSNDPAGSNLIRLNEQVRSAIAWLADAGVLSASSADKCAQAHELSVQEFGNLLSEAAAKASERHDLEAIRKILRLLESYPEVAEVSCISVSPRSPQTKISQGKTWEILDSVPTEHWAYKAMDYLINSKKIPQGLGDYPKDFFAGTSVRSRSDFAWAIARMSDYVMIVDGIPERKADDQVKILLDELRAEFSDRLWELGWTSNEESSE